MYTVYNGIEIEPVRNTVERYTAATAAAASEQMPLPIPYYFVIKN